MLGLSRSPFEVEEVLLSSKLDKSKFEFGIPRLEHAQECGYGIGANCSNGDSGLFLQLLVGTQKRVRGAVIAPIAQGLSLINGFVRPAQDQPRDKAHSGDEQCDGQVSPFVCHVHFTPGLGATSRPTFLSSDASYIINSKAISSSAWTSSGTPDLASLSKPSRLNAAFTQT